MNRILRCPDCNTPLVPGSISCIKCNKQFSKPIPKIAEPKAAEPPIVPISVTPIATPLKSAYKPQSKVLFATVLIVVCLIALVTFVVNRSQANERQALAQKQAYQQVLQNRTQLQQAPVAVSMPAPVVMTPAPTFKRNDANSSKFNGGTPPSADVPSSNDNTPANQVDSAQQQAQVSQVDMTRQQVSQYYDDGVSAYQMAKSDAESDQGFLNGSQGIRDLSQYTNQIFSDSKAIRNMESRVSDETQRNLYEAGAMRLDRMALWTQMPAYPPPY